MHVALSLIFISILMLFLYLFSLKRYWDQKNVRSLLMFPISGSLKMLSLQMSIGDFLWNVYRRTESSIIGFHVCGTPSVLIKDVKTMKKILIKDFDNFNHRTMGVNYEGDPIGTKMLFSARNPTWKLMRKNLSSSFSTERMRILYPAINSIGDNLTKYLKNHDGKPIETKEVFHKYSTDIITSSALAIKANSFEDDQAISRTIARRIFASSFWRGFQFNTYFLLPNLARSLNLKFMDQLGSKFVQDVIGEIREDRNKNNSHRNDFVGKLLELERKNIYVQDKNEIHAQALQFWAAGFETIGSSIMYLCNELAHHPDIQDKLREEIISTLKDGDGQVSYDTIRDMPYLTMVTTETFRKYPVLPFLDRLCLSDYKIPDTDTVLDKGTNVYISIQGLHYDKQHFPDPYKFDPERFHPKKKTSETFTFLTFGEGPRHCIGMRFGKISVLVAIVKLLSQFRIVPVDKYKDMEFDGRIFLLSPKNLIYLKFEPL